jgi:hypothetical protein
VTYVEKWKEKGDRKGEERAGEKGFPNCEGKSDDNNENSYSLMSAGCMQ